MRHWVLFAVGSLVVVGLGCSGFPTLPTPEEPPPEVEPEPEPEPEPEVPAGFTVPTPDASWQVHSFKTVGFRLQTPVGMGAAETADGATLTLAATGASLSPCTDFADRVASTKGALVDHTERILLDEATALVFNSGDGEAGGCQVLASHESGGKTWCLGTDAPAETKVATLVECGNLVASVRTVEARPGAPGGGEKGKTKRPH